MEQEHFKEVILGALTMAGLAVSAVAWATDGTERLWLTTLGLVLLTGASVLALALYAREPR